MELVKEPDMVPPTGRVPRKLALSSPLLHRAQRRHFLLCNVLPLAGTVAALLLTWRYGFGRFEFGLFFLMWYVTGISVSTGYHRLFTHGAFKTVGAIRVLLAVFASMAAQGPVISWAAIHRRHHQFADRAGDMHSPNMHGSSVLGRIRGLVHAHYTWMYEHDYPNVAFYVPDLLADRAMVRVSKMYYWWIALGLAMPTLAGWLLTGTAYGALAGLLWGGAVRIFVLGQLIATLNSLLHVAGSRSFRVRGEDDNSRNSWVLGILLWGEGWHNNHHAFPYSAWFGLSWLRFDTSYALILALKAVGLAWDVKVPTLAQTAAKRRSNGELKSAS